ncbi:MAG: hypothetical protein JWN59_1214 [Sphingomonas bacterium]|nr:hypothetical protein [Sphingomonas bacterium]MDB5682865.1 hypothetical protein [Sphingomonas bacterium]
MRLRIFTLLGLAAVSLPAVAQARHDTQLWGGGSATVKLGDRFRVSQDITVRLSDNRHGLYEVELNTLLGYALTKDVVVWAGYTHDPNYTGGDFAVMEHRGRQQITVDNILKIGRGTVSGRVRLEQRWREHIEGTAWRLRPFVRFRLPLAQGGRTMLVLSHESFIDLDRTSFQTVQGEERMRNLVALSVPIAKQVDAEIGYLNQHAFIRHGPDNDDNVASVALNLSF